MFWINVRNKTPDAEVRGLCVCQRSKISNVLKADISSFPAINAAQDCKESKVR
jgi:hypothetical protein